MQAQHATGQTVKSSHLCNSSPFDLAFLTEEQLIAQALILMDKFNSNWITCMNNHYSSGIYIDAEIAMNNAYAMLQRILDYIYAYRSSSFYDTLNDLLKNLCVYS
jgi:hypothetical protein